MIEKVIDILFMTTDVIVCGDYETAARTAQMLVEVFGNPTTYQMHCKWQQRNGVFVFEVQIPKRYQKQYNRTFSDKIKPKEIGAA